MNSDSKACIACAEPILSVALLCKFCKTLQNDSRYLVEQVASKEPATSESPSDVTEALLRPPGSENHSFFGGEGGSLESRKSPKLLVFGASVLGLISLLAILLLLPKSQSQLSGLNSAQSQMLDDFLNSLSGGYDDELRTVATCVVLSYDELNVTFSDPSARSVALARVQDCVESRDSKMTCGEADNGTGPICGLAGTRTGYSISSVFGAMLGLVGSNQNNGSSSNDDATGATSTRAESDAVNDDADALTSPNTSATAEANRGNTSGKVALPEQEELDAYQTPDPVSAKEVWVPTFENIKACSLDSDDEKCPNDYLNYVAEAKNTFGVNSQELVQRMISAGICKEWPSENKVWEKPTIENACLGERHAFYVSTGDAEIWELINIRRAGEVYAAGDGWAVYANYASLEYMQIAADVLGGIAWQRGY